MSLCIKTRRWRWSKMYLGHFTNLREKRGMQWGCCKRAQSMKVPMGSRVSNQPSQFPAGLNVAADTEVARGLLEDKGLRCLLHGLSRRVWRELLLRCPRSRLFCDRRLQECPTTEEWAMGNGDSANQEYNNANARQRQATHNGHHEQLPHKCTQLAGSVQAEATAKLLSKVGKRA